MSLIHNERVKLTAAWLNGLAGASAAAGSIAPLVAGFYGVKTSLFKSSLWVKPGRLFVDGSSVPQGLRNIAKVHLAQGVRLSRHVGACLGARHFRRSAPSLRSPNIPAPNRSTAPGPNVFAGSRVPGWGRCGIWRSAERGCRSIAIHQNAVIARRSSQAASGGRRQLPDPHVVSKGFSWCAVSFTT